MAAECTEKLCSKCGILKPINDFNKFHRRGRVELESQCKMCRHAISRIYYEKNKKKILDKQKKRTQSNPERRREQCAKSMREYRKRHPQETKNRARNANKKHAGLNLEKFNVLYEKQKGLCAICGLPETSKIGGSKTEADLSIDHNHNTNKIRGLLCSKCNCALGLLKVDNFGVLNLQKAIEYLGV